MPNLSHIVGQLQTERKLVQSELGRLDAAIDALQGSNPSNGSHTIAVASPRPRRTLSAAGRRAISLAQKARWAKRAVNGQAVTRPKRTMSAAARRKIATAQKARWAAWKTKQKRAA
jgi:hypothetical protein